MPCASLDHGQHCAIWPLLAMPRPLVASLLLPSELVRCLPPRLIPSAGGMLLRLASYFQKWLLDTDNWRPPRARGRDSTWIFPIPCCAVQVWGQLVLEHGRGNPDGLLSHLLGAHLYNSATFATQNKALQIMNIVFRVEHPIHFF